MPENFPESWEYYTPDEEIEDSLEDSSNRKIGIASLGVRYGESLPYRFIPTSKTQRRLLTDEELRITAYLYSIGTSLKDIARLTGCTIHAVHTRLRKSKVVRNRQGSPRGQAVCPVCQKVFTKPKKDSVHCSKKCCGVTHVRTLKESGKPLWEYAKSIRYRKQTKRHVKRRTFSLLWRHGIPMWEICVRLKSAFVTLNKWRKELGLPSRKKEKTGAPK